MAGLFRMRPSWKITKTDNGLLVTWYEGEPLSERVHHFDTWDAVAFQFSEPVGEALELGPAPELTPEQEARLSRVESQADSVGDEVPG